MAFHVSDTWRAVPDPAIRRPERVPYITASGRRMAELINPVGDRIRIYVNMAAGNRGGWLVRNRHTGEEFRGTADSVPLAEFYGAEAALKQWPRLKRDPARVDLILGRSNNPDA